HKGGTSSLLQSCWVVAVACAHSLISCTGSTFTVMPFPTKHTIVSSTGSDLCSGQGALSQDSKRQQYSEVFVERGGIYSRVRTKREYCWERVARGADCVIC